jgi:hypothetical protein
MLWRILILIIEVLAFLFLMKSSFWLSALQNVPFIGVVADVVGSLFGINGAALGFPQFQSFPEEFLKALIFTCLFAILNPLINTICKITIGKHSYNLPFKKAVDSMVLGFISNMACIILTTFIMGYIGLFQQNNSFIAPWLSWVISLGGLTGIIAVAFFLFRQPVMLFLLWLFGKFIIPTVLKIITVEFLAIWVFLILNIPGMMEDVGTLVLMVIGIGLCMGSLFGISVYDDKIDDYWKPGKHS